MRPDQSEELLLFLFVCLFVLFYFCWSFFYELRRWRGSVAKAPDLKSGDPGFKCRLGQACK